MVPKPPYHVDRVTYAYQLRYIWTGWPSEAPLPSEPTKTLFAPLLERWETDGIRVLERYCSPRKVSFLASVVPWVSPVFFATRMKGRLQHALRCAETPVQFSRKLAVRTVGDTRTDQVEAYVENQVLREDFADPRFADFMHDFTVVRPEVDLSDATATRSGRYWYNLHLVLVVRERFRFTEAVSLGKLRDGALRVAELKGHQISRLSVMPDHLHMTLRGHIGFSPEEIALNYMNNLAYLLREDELWQTSYYVGTFGKYDMGAIRASQKKLRGA